MWGIFFWLPLFLLGLYIFRSIRVDLGIFHSPPHRKIPLNLLNVKENLFNFEKNVCFTVNTNNKK